MHVFGHAFGSSGVGQSQSSQTEPMQNYFPLNCKTELTSIVIAGLYIFVKKEAL